MLDALCCCFADCVADLDRLDEADGVVFEACLDGPFGRADSLPLFTRLCVLFGCCPLGNAVFECGVLEVKDEGEELFVPALCLVSLAGVAWPLAVFDEASFGTISDVLLVDILFRRRRPPLGVNSF